MIDTFDDFFGDKLSEGRQFLLLPFSGKEGIPHWLERGRWRE